MPVANVDLEHGIWQRLYDGTFELDYVVFRQANYLPLLEAARYPAQ